jgi:hypothetical protein
VAVTMIIQIHSYWNGLFFMRQAVEAHVLSTLGAHKMFEGGADVRVSQLNKMYAGKAAVKGKKS